MQDGNRSGSYPAARTFLSAIDLNIGTTLDL
jgi:hypothetical protein